MVDVLAGTLVVGLVSFRLWRLLALDTITAPARQLLYDRVTPDRQGWAATVLYWLQCPWCAGFWLSGAVAVAVATVVTGDPWDFTVLLVWGGAAAVVPVLATVTGDARSDA